MDKSLQGKYAYNEFQQISADYESQAEILAKKI
jgi:hypothetical protein